MEECYLYDPDRSELTGWQRIDGRLTPIENMLGWISPRLGIRFEMKDGELELYHPNGRRFSTFVELYEERAEAERIAAESRHLAEQAQAQAEQARAQAERWAAQLRALGVEPEKLP